MNKNSILRTLLPAVMAIAITVPALAVSDNEMEQARTIAAKMYLRYANNGSGYLDDVKATNMADLQKVLKKKEQENIKAFLSIPVPKDYAQWDKAKLVEYWSATAFNAPGLIEQGQGAKSRVRKQIEAMTVSAPAAQPTPASVDPEVTAPVAADTAASAVPSDIVNQEQDILADQKAIAADNQNPTLESPSNHTWIYVAILVILIAVVIWLVIYAAKVMKRQQASDGDDGASGADVEELRDRANRAIAQCKEKIEELNDKLQNAEAQLAETENEAKRYKEDNRRLNERIAELQERLRNAAAMVSGATQAPAPAQATRQQSRPQPDRNTDDILHVIYLGRANSRGIFVRADRNYSNGNTVYRLDTEDGLTGTFAYVDNPAMNRVVLDRPKEMLSGGCSADDIEDTIGATEIVTESRGTAIFENGYWKVLRKSRIRFK